MIADLQPQGAAETIAIPGATCFVAEVAAFPCGNPPCPG
jgi:hypothetical protein